MVDLNIKNIKGDAGDKRRHKYQIQREKTVSTPMRHNFLLNPNARTWNMLPSE